MNREIKFRVWDKRTQCMFNWQGCRNLSLDDLFKDKKIIPQQFIGFKDKNGKEIYEGDIVKCRGLSTIEVVIVEDIRSVPVQISCWPTIYGKGNGECEVIGNVLENEIKG